MVSAPQFFDRIWHFALGATEDAGIQVTRADRTAGRIEGSMAGAAVTIELQEQSDGSVEFKFSAPDSEEVEQDLGVRWQKALHARVALFSRLPGSDATPGA